MTSLRRRTSWATCWMILITQMAGHTWSEPHARGQAGAVQNHKSWTGRPSQRARATGRDLLARPSVRSTSKLGLRQRKGRDSRPSPRLAHSSKSRPRLSSYYSFREGSFGKLPGQADTAQTPCTEAGDCPSRLHWCLEGVCTCPPILRGDGLCTTQTTTSKLRSYCFMGLRAKKIAKALNMDPYYRNGTLGFLLDSMAGDNGVQDLDKRRDWSTCAVVGSSGTLRATRPGDAIDGHTAVIRFNNAPTKGFEEYAGSRTTLRIQNQDYCRFAEHEEETCVSYTLRGMCRPSSAAKSFPNRCSDENMVTVSKPFSTYVHQYWTINRPKVGGKQMLDEACRWICPPAGLKMSGAKISENLPEPKEEDMAEAIRQCKRRCDKKISAGFFGVLFASHLCGEVHVYGFPKGPAKGPMKYYFPKKVMTSSRGRNPPQFRHHWRFERHCLDYIRRGGIHGIFFH